MRRSLRLLMRKLRIAAIQVGYLPRALALVWNAAHRWTVAWVALLIVQGILPAVAVYLTRGLVDSLVGCVAAHAGTARLQPVILYAALMAGALALAEVARSAAGLVRTAQAELVQDHISGLLHAQSAAVDVAFHESPEYYDHLHRARGDAVYRPLYLLESLGGLLQSAITLAAMAVVLLPYGLWLPIALLIGTLPAFFVVLRYSIRQHEFWERTTADQRRAEYYDWLLTSGEVAGELRLFSLGDYFHNLYQVLRGRLRLERTRLAVSESVASLLSGLLALVVTGASVGWMVFRLTRGQVTLGGLALFWAAFTQGQGLMRSLLEHAGQIYANSLFLGHLFEFLGLKPLVADPADPLPAPSTLCESLRFNGVSFRYPGGERLALERFHLEIPAGQIVAIVGANGAGKSTLLKLLCRLYDPEEGSVELDGVDMRRFRVRDLRRMVTVLFQQPVKYSATAAENIALGDRTPDRDRVEAAADQAGASEIVARLPEGYDSLLGKWFAGGAELSGGEWQRIALARAFHRRAPLLLLDEPTSAMDSWAEEEWLRRFRLLAAGRTVVVITHRFTTAMRADIIHVMEAGRIVESGSHVELLARRGRYAQSWRAQVQAGEGVPVPC